jgi:hypothetical protein
MQLTARVRTHEEVAGLDVAVHDSEGVSLGKRIAGLEDDLARLDLRKHTSNAHLLAQGASLQKLEYQVRTRLPNTRIRDATGVLAHQARSQARLTKEPRFSGERSCNIGAQKFHGHMMAVDQVFGLGDDTHSPASDDAADAVLVVDDSTGNHEVCFKDISIG